MKLYVFLTTVAFASATVDTKQIKNILQMINNNFTGKMLSKLIEENPEKSIVLSAFSVLTPLAQLAIASEGRTHDELLNLISLPNDYSILSVFSFINIKIRSIQGIELQMSNRIYIPLNYKLNDNFAVISKDIFKSQVENVDFANKLQTAEKINNWVEIESNHRIKEVIKSSNLGDNVRAIIVNVLYFKGKWKTQFDKRQTAIKPFYVNRNEYVNVPIMRNNANYKYGYSYKLDAKILEMPYVGEQSSMVIILPSAIDGVRSLIEKLEDLSVLDQEMKYISEVEVDVSLPKFKIESEINLKTILQKLNVTKIFNAEANLNKLLQSPEELFISQAIQKSFVEINEEGAEASAANILEISLKSSFTPTPVFNANHPFVFVLRSQYIHLFSGVYNG